MKWKSGTSMSRHELQVTITVNKEIYSVKPFQYPTQTGKFHVEVKQADEGRIALTASTDSPMNGQDVLQVLHFTYDHLKPRGTPAKA
jgi:hypothetical protein